MQKKQYEAPVVEQMECKVERGYSASGSAEPQQVEQFEQGASYNGDQLFS